VKLLFEASIHKARFITSTQLIEATSCVDRWNATINSLSPLASSEALVVLHWAMRPASHRHIRMVVEIVVDLPAFFVASISLLATTIS
jgi:hypothetical protein